MSMKTVPFLLATILLFSGCLGSGEGTPEEQVETAVERLAEGMGPDGDVKKLDGEFEAEGMSMDMEVEIGSNDAIRIHVDAGMFQVVMTCVEDRSFLSFAGEAYESRYDEEMCSMETEDGPSIGMDEEAETEILSVEEQDDGSLIAELRQTEDGEETLMTVTVRDGRVVEFEMEDDEFTAGFEVEYGTRRTISTPDPEGRVPVDVQSTSTFAQGTYEGTIEAVETEADLSEFELHIYEHGEEPLAAFPIDIEGQQAMQGFDFTFEDNGDGLLSEGDRFTVEHDDWEYEYEYEVVFFDEWAGVRTDENPIPLGLGVWLLLVLALLIGGRRLRQN